MKRSVCPSDRPSVPSIDISISACYIKPGGFAVAGAGAQQQTLAVWR